MTTPHFNLSHSDGTTQSERVLAKLCRKSFLSLWTYPQLYSDRTKKNGKVIAKEIVDVGVFFGNDVILFSDKQSVFQSDSDPTLAMRAWKRFYARTVQESAAQLWGAKRYIENNPKGIFVDNKCGKPLSVELPKMSVVKFHLVAVTRGSYGPCQRFFGSSGIGSHVIDTRLEGNGDSLTPFVVGDVDRSKPFVHVFDEHTIELLTTHLDTIPDFLQYLNSREMLFRSNDVSVFSPGEEQLLAAYMRNDKDGIEAFLPDWSKHQGHKHIVLDESFYPALQTDKNYLEKKKREHVSYYWDELIEKLTNIGSPDHAHPEVRQSPQETESALRELADENRSDRTTLTKAIVEFYEFANSNPLRQRVRTFCIDQEKSKWYLVLLLPRDRDEAYTEYVKRRNVEIHAYCRCAVLKYPSMKRVIGLGFDHPTKNYEGGSEVLFAYHVPKLTEQEVEQLRDQCWSCGLFRKEILQKWPDYAG